MAKKKALETDDGLTDKQRIFIAEYLKSKNATQAYIAAGYSPNPESADVSARRLLGKPRIANAVRQGMQKLQKKVYIAAESVLIELGKIAFADPRKCFNENGDLLPPKEWPDEIASAISEIVVEEIKEPYTGDVLGHVKKIKFWNKNQALDSLGKHFKLFSDKIEIDIGPGLADRLAAARAYAVEVKKKRLIENVKQDEPEDGSGSGAGEGDSSDSG